MDLSKYSDDDLAYLAESPNASSTLKTQARSLLKDRERQAAQAIPTEANPNVDPVTGAPTGGAPGFLVNALPSAVNFGNSMVGGIANAFTNNPLDTISNLPGAIAQHYGDRYSSPEQALQTFNQDPFGAVMDVVPVGTGLRLGGWLGKAAGASKAGAAAGTVGRGLERLDPVGGIMGAVQGGVMAGMNRFTPNRTPEAVMAGTEYGGVQGRQGQYLDEYYADVGRALDEGYGNTLPDVNRAEAQLGGAKGTLGDILEAADDVQINRVDVIKQLEALKTGKSANLDSAYLETIDKAIKEVMDFDGDSRYLTPQQLNTVKSRLQGKTNWNAVDDAGIDATQAFADSSRVARTAVREAVPEAAGALDEVRQLSTVEDLVRRGHIQNMPNVGGGTAGSFLAQGVDLLAPIVTGQRKAKRNQIRRDIREGNPRALNSLTERTAYGPIREGAYLSEMERNYDPSADQWHVGRLWSE